MYREQARNDLLLKQQKAINEVNEAKLIAQSQPNAEDLADVVQQVAEDIKQKEMEKLRIQYDMYKDTHTHSATTSLGQAPALVPR